MLLGPFPQQIFTRWKLKLIHVIVYGLHMLTLHLLVIRIIFSATTAFSAENSSRVGYANIRVTVFVRIFIDFGNRPITVVSEIIAMSRIFVGKTSFSFVLVKKYSSPVFLSWTNCRNEVIILEVAQIQDISFSQTGEARGNRNEIKGDSDHVTHVHFLERPVFTQLHSGNKKRG